MRETIRRREERDKSSRQESISSSLQNPELERKGFAAPPGVCLSVCAWKSRNRTRMKLAHNYQRNIVLESSPFKNRMTMGWMRVLPSWRCILDPGWNTHPAVVVFILLTRKRVWLRDLLHPTHRCFRDLYSLKKLFSSHNVFDLLSQRGKKQKEGRNRWIKEEKRLKKIEMAMMFLVCVGSKSI